MVSRIIQNNPFSLTKVDKKIFNTDGEENFNEKIISDYFNYIKPKIKNEAIFRLLSPLLQIFFGLPDSKKLKIEINERIRNKEIENLEFLLLKFISQNKNLSID